MPQESLVTTWKFNTKGSTITITTYKQPGESEQDFEDRHAADVAEVQAEFPPVT